MYVFFVSVCEALAMGAGACMAFMLTMAFVRMMKQDPANSTEAQVGLMRERNELDVEKVAALAKLSSLGEQLLHHHLKHWLVKANVFTEATTDMRDYLRRIVEKLESDDQDPKIPQEIQDSIFLEWTEHDKQQCEGQFGTVFTADKYIAGIRFEYCISQCVICKNHYDLSIESDSSDGTMVVTASDVEHGKAEALRHLRSVITGIPA